LDRGIGINGWYGHCLVGIGWIVSMGEFLWKSAYKCGWEMVDTFGIGIIFIEHCGVGDFVQ
jgi:hypothetical protein